MTEPSLLERIRGTFPDHLIRTHAFRGDETALIRREGLLPVVRWLRDGAGLPFDFLMDLTALDHLGKEPRFEVVYHFYSLPLNQRIRLKVPLEEADPVVDSLSGEYAAADWFEREVFDMFGIRFRGHPNLKRILLYEGFQGHPLRKDYPIRKRQPILGPEN